MAQTLLPGSILSMPAEAADRLLRGGSGDSALLYLHLLRHGGVEGLNWESLRLQGALEVLERLQMAPKIQVPAPTPPPPVEIPLPTYTVEDISQALGEQASPFTLVADEVERQLGKKLNATDLKSLYTLYDHLALPPEVILLLTTYCVEEHQRKFGTGRRPFVSVLKKEGFAWSRKGIETVERAEEFLRKQTFLRSREGTILQLLDIQPRPLVTREESYISEWQTMGFPDEVIRVAYEKTVMKKGSLDWSYLTGILRNWHQRGLHSLDDIQKKDKGSAPQGQVGFRPQPTAAPTAPQQNDKARDDMDRMRRLMEQMKREED